MCIFIDLLDNCLVDCLPYLWQLIMCQYFKLLLWEHNTVLSYVYLSWNINYYLHTDSREQQSVLGQMVWRTGIENNFIINSFNGTVGKSRAGWLWQHIQSEGTFVIIWTNNDMKPMKIHLFRCAVCRHYQTHGPIWWGNRFSYFLKCLLLERAKEDNILE